MSDKGNAQEVINAYQRRQARTPRIFILSALALILIFVGAVLLWKWYTNPEGLLSYFATPTATATSTPTTTPVPPTATPLPPTQTPTVTLTPTITPTPTIEGPFLYTVQEGENLFAIAEKFGVDVLRIMEANDLQYDSVIFVGQVILIPDPNEEAPTATPVPENLPRGTKIEYRVLPGDSLTSIAITFNSTEEAILEANEDIENANEIFVGQILIVPVNLVTPAPTATGAELGSTPGAIMTLTPEPSSTP